MLSLVPECLSAYKKIIDDGYAQPFGEALVTERKLSAASNKAVSAEEIERRREAVRARGQSQKG
jgi:enoyl-CoA hydratase